MKFAITKKIGMTRTFDEDGLFVATSILSFVPIKIKQIKNIDSEGYNSIVVEEDNKDKKNPKLYEFRVEDTSKYKVGDKIEISEFKIGDTLEVNGKSKGKGFSGAIKRHGFSRGPKTHGSDHHRKTGSIGGAYPQRVVKGKKMPGRFGGSMVTTKNLKVVELIEDKILVAGSVPGPNKSIIKISSK